MFGPVSMWELIVIFIVILIFFGPKKLPELGRSIGRGLSEFRRASSDLKRSLEEEITAVDPPAERNKTSKDPYKESKETGPAG